MLPTLQTFYILLPVQISKPCFQREYKLNWIKVFSHERRMGLLVTDHWWVGSLVPLYLLPLTRSISGLAWRSNG